MSDIAVSFQNVSKYYKLYGSPKDRLKEALHPLGRKYHKEFYALKNISFELGKGKILGVIGKNGSGKSTLLKVMSKVLMPNQGVVQVDGSISALIELGAGFNPQFTGLENVFFYGTVLGFSREYMEERLEDILAFADIGEFIHQPIKMYSSGMRARLAFAVATEIDPEILIVDEVLAVGDAIFQRKCYAKIKNMFKDGKTVILVSHNRNAIVGLCEEALLIDSGDLLCSGEAEKVVREYEKLCNKKYLESKRNKKGPEAKKPPQKTGAQKNKQDPESELFWDDNLRSDDQIFFKKSDIEFEEFGMYTLDGNKVNVLKSGLSYKIKASFVPNEDVYADVIFAVRITNLQGYIVSWLGFPLEKGHCLKVRKGKRIDIEYVFDNNLLHGVYSVDAGLQSTKENEIYIHVGIQKLYLFKVHQDVALKKQGIVDLNCRLEVK